jgi:hypothetical protein
MNDHMNKRSPIDFSALGAPVPANRFEESIATVVRRGEDDLRRRRGGAAIVRVVIAWRRPVLALSGLAAAAAIALLVRTVQSAPPQRAESASIAEALGIPAAYTETVEGRITRGAGAAQVRQ